MIGPNPPLEELATAFQAWIDERASDHARFKTLPLEFGERYEPLCALQAEMYDAGWARYGWQEEYGGLGGTVLHRALMVDLLERNGYPQRHFFEHLEILPPAMERFGSKTLLDEVFLPTLRGDVLWCQGFSEPTAGSDLASLKTTAKRVDGGYRLDGHKIWTSWAKWATHLLLLARTGTPEDRHRGLSAFVTPLAVPGLQVGPIKQSNGQDELAEVFLDDVFVPETHRVGDEGKGWAVAMHILAGERGSYAWLRSSEILQKLEKLAAAPGAADHAGILGDSLIRLLALRCRARPVLEILARGEAPGPESSVTKVLVIDTEQHFYDVAREVYSPGFDLGTIADAERWQEAYLYSRASSVYGGSKQIQYNVIAKLLVSKGGVAEEPADDDLAMVQQSVAEALDKSEDARDALAGLDWWSFAASPEDAFGRAAFAAWFEGQGGAVASGPALAGVRAALVATALGVEAGEVAVGIRSGDAVLAVGLDARSKWLAVYDADGGVRAFSADTVHEAEPGALDPAVVRAVTLTANGGEAIDLDAAADARALDLARIAAAFEITGAARALLVRAVTHTNEREQFGQPIASFQAIQHILSEAQVELSALAELCRAALEEWSAGGGQELAAAAKGLAGRAGRMVAQHALQCFGAIGFTDEHEHHLYSRRIHTLDALFGSMYTLRKELGAEVVRTGHAPRGIEVYRHREGEA